MILWLMMLRSMWYWLKIFTSMNTCNLSDSEWNSFYNHHVCVDAPTRWMSNLWCFKQLVQSDWSVTFSQAFFKLFFFRQSKQLFLHTFSWHPVFCNWKHIVHNPIYTWHCVVYSLSINMWQYTNLSLMQKLKMNLLFNIFYCLTFSGASTIMLCTMAEKLNLRY